MVKLMPKSEKVRSDVWFGACTLFSLDEEVEDEAVFLSLL